MGFFMPMASPSSKKTERLFIKISIAIIVQQAAKILSNLKNPLGIGRNFIYHYDKNNPAQPIRLFSFPITN